jgi:hypothetical protein
MKFLDEAKVYVRSGDGRVAFKARKTARAEPCDTLFQYAGAILYFREE